MQSFCPTAVFKHSEQLRLDGTLIGAKILKASRPQHSHTRELIPRDVIRNKGLKPVWSLACLPSGMTQPHFTR